MKKVVVLGLLAACAHEQISQPPGNHKQAATGSDATFEQLARDVAKQSERTILWWGPVQYDDQKARRTAYLQSTNLDGDARFTILVEVEPAVTVAISAQTYGTPDMQGPFTTAEPAWGKVAPLVVESKWMHGSHEQVGFTYDGKAFVVTHEDFVSREKGGPNGFDVTEDKKQFPAAQRPELATFKAHSARFAVSAPSSSAKDLAGAIHEMPVQ